MNPVVSSSHQMSIDFEPGLAERHQSALDCVRECAYTHKHPLKTLAADMDMSQSELSRKLAHNPDDPRRFTLDDLEKFLTATGDMTPIAGNEGPARYGRSRSIALLGVFGRSERNDEC